MSVEVLVMSFGLLPTIPPSPLKVPSPGGT
jgi:hypothetical protein